MARQALKGMMERTASFLTVSAFPESVALSVPEFIAAGDNLVAKCPTWSWDSGELSKQKSHLPAGKQFLIARNVPCQRRAISDIEEGEIVDGGGDGDDDAESADEVKLPSIQESPNKNTSLQKISSYFGVGKKEDVTDVQKFIETKPESEDSHTICPESYDISITYDKDSQTPHFWLSGYSQSGRLLKPELVLQDISRDHAGKTVTIEDHPHLSGKHASVNPRDYGAATKNIVDDLKSRGVEPTVDSYLFLFLKFVASVFPTIQYGHVTVSDHESCCNLKVETRF